MTQQNYDAKDLHALQDALRHLYEPAELRKSPFVSYFGIDAQADAMLELRKILLDGIQNLKPKGRIVPTSKAWKIYTVLSHRFIEQFNQKQVAADLAISIRQLRRLEIMALEALMDELSTQRVAGPAVPSLSMQPVLLPENSLPQPEISGQTPYAQQELEWLRRSMKNEAVDLQILLESSLRTVMALFRANRITTQVQAPETGLLVAGQLTILRQALVNALTLAGQAVAGGQVIIRVEEQPKLILLHIAVIGSLSSQVLTPSQEEIISMTRQLVDLSDGQLELNWSTSPGTSLEMSISLPLVSSWSVLVVDDNQDALQLVRRYLAGSRYRFIGAADPQQVIALIEEVHPNAIILDVMLPEIDGWELLGRIREHPALQAAPIIVSTILPQESLAATLGASAFLHKPFSQADLLSLLDHFVNPTGTGSH